MKREYFIIHLEAHGCTLIREDRKGYSCYRHRDNGTKSGVPKADADGMLGAATICRVCKTLGIEIPKAISEARIVEFDSSGFPKPSEFVAMADERRSLIDGSMSTDLGDTTSENSSGSQTA